jgi:glutamyl-tRNA synthetase
LKVSPFPLARIAPTPSGFLHEGNLLNFLLVSRIAQKVNAKVFLRIDDLDFERFRYEYLEDIYRVLNHFDISWDLGPKTPDDLIYSWSQKLRLNLYEAIINRLIDTGNVYACNCSRTTLSTLGLKSKYSGICRHKNIPLDTPEVCLRIKTDPNCSITFEDKNLGTVSSTIFNTVGDFIIRRKDGIPSYQIASFADDVYYGVSHIVRGMDLLDSTFCQIYLSTLLQENEFRKIAYYHHELICSESGDKLSKSTSGTEVSKSLVELYDEVPEHVMSIANDFIQRIK